MLMQNFMSADTLGLKEIEYTSLIKVLVMLETGQIERNKEELLIPGKMMFNMDDWCSGNHHCGTVSCIGGTAELVGGFKFVQWKIKHDRPELYELFYPTTYNNFSDITAQQAARALRNYLTTGKANWNEVLNSDQAMAVSVSELS
jgi:hypothetical protein